MTRQLQPVLKLNRFVNDEDVNAISVSEKGRMERRRDLRTQVAR